MNPILISFFNKQKNQSYSSKSSKKKVTKNKFIIRNTSATYIFSQYLHIENILYRKTSLPSYKDYNIYSSFIELSGVDTLNYHEKTDNKAKVDIFGFYRAIQLAFKTTHCLIKIRPNEVAFFYYYNKAFINNFYIIKNSSNNNLVANNYTRFDYQRKLQIRTQSNFVFNGSQVGFSFFNRVFSQNNTPFISLKKKIAKVFSKKLRSTKVIRSATLEDNYTKRFNSRRQLTSFLKLYKGRRFRQKSATYIFKSKAIFPKNTWFRNQVVKVLIRQKKSKTIMKHLTYNTKIHSKKDGSHYKSLVPSALHFKLFPTEYEEDTLNPNKFNQFKALASFRTHSRFSFYQINAISLTRFMFDSQMKDVEKYVASKRKLSQFYLNSRERERMSRYRYIGIYRKDLIRVCFFSRYLKKADFLASFFAFTISKLPRNRKELKYVHFLIKLLKMFASRNKDILGIRIRFQGRLNRWRRTKHIIGSKGNIAFSRYRNRIEYGRAQAITRKGTLGVHVWIAYQPGSFDALSKRIISYMNLSPRAILSK